MSEKNSHEVLIEPFGTVLSAAPGTNLGSLLREKGIPFRSDCGGRGVCGKCALTITGNGEAASRPALACQTQILSDLRVELPLSGLINPSEAVDKATDLEVPPLPKSARPGFGIAVDLGTTTIAGFLCDYTTGTVAGAVVVPNPQSIYGADVMSRITAADSDPKHLRLLTRLAVSTVDEIVLTLTKNAGAAPEKVEEIVLVGNPTMLHLFLGINPACLGQSPFMPAFRERQERTASEVGLTANAHAKITTLPLVSGFVGADLVSAALARKMCDCEDGTILIDIGTNGEIVLKSNGNFYATSCATGPAFEGATIAHGMLALSGAIDSFRFDPGDGAPHYTLIRKRAGEPRRARGICGSGLISLAAALLEQGLILPHGRFNPDSANPGLRPGTNGAAEFVVVRSAETETGRDIVLTQADVRALQLAKGAVHAGIELLCRSAGCGYPKEIILAGAFGSHVNVNDLLTVGLLPPGSANIRVVGNAAGMGAVEAVLDPQFRKDADAFAERITVVDLAAQPDFQDVFLNSLGFPAGAR